MAFPLSVIRASSGAAETTAWTPATGPTDPRIGQLFRELFQVVFTDSQSYRPLGGKKNMP